MNNAERRLYLAARRLVPQFKKELYLLRDRQNFVSIGDNEDIEINIETTIAQLDRFVRAVENFEKYHAPFADGSRR